MKSVLDISEHYPLIPKYPGFTSILGDVMKALVQKMHNFLSVYLHQL